MTIEARRAIRVPVSETQSITFMLADFEQDEDGAKITVIYEDATGENVVNILPVEEVEAKLQTIYPGESFSRILELLPARTPAPETPVKRIITNLN